MITFNDLHINEEKDRLYIDCMVDDEHVDLDVWISSIRLVYYDNMLPNGLIKDSNKVVTIYDDFDGTNQYIDYKGYVPVSDLEPMGDVDTPEVVFDKGLFYVIVTCDGEDVPDGYQDIVVIPDWQFIYSIGMPYLSELAYGKDNKCEPNSRFEEFVLIWYGLQLAFSTCEFAQVDMLWRKFLRISGNGGSGGGRCSCNR